MTSSRDGDATAGHGHEALKAIDDAKDRILELVDTIFHEVADDAVTEDFTEIPRFLSAKPLYLIDVRLNDAFDTVEKHHFWSQVTAIVKSLIRSLRQMTEVGTFPDPDEIGLELREHGVEPRSLSDLTHRRGQGGLGRSPV